MGEDLNLRPLVHVYIDKLSSCFSVSTTSTNFKNPKLQTFNPTH